MSARYFVFIEFSDQEVRDFLARLKTALGGARFEDTPHITVRGPYTSPPDPQVIEQLGEKLHGNGVLVAEVGVFSTPKGHAVFLHAKSKLFEGIWWKPDYSGPAHRRIPHVTLYETPSRDRANTVRDFLRSECVEIVTYGVELTVYTSKQQTLLAPDEVPVLARRKLPPERISFREGLFDRAKKLRDYLEGRSEGAGPQSVLF
jgi:hypothetical protein